jgi:hypothetical protein
MLKSLAIGVIATSVLALTGTAQASTLGFSASIDGTPSSGLTIYNGGNGTAFGPLDVFDDGTTALFENSAGIATGSTSGQYAAPWTGGGQETTPYFYAQTGGDVVFSFSNATNEVGFLWGSVDTDAGRNEVSVYSGAGGSGTLLGQFSGADVQNAVPNLQVGSWGEDGSVYANITSPDTPIGSVVFSDSSSNAFEFDQVSAVPLPGALPLFGTALLGLTALARRRRVVA